MNVKFHFPGPVKDMQPRKTDPEIIDINDHNEIVSALVEALEKAVEDYGKPGGPWNVPSEPGTWLAMAQAALAKARGEANEQG